MTSAIYRRSAELLEADLGNELIALDPERGRCFGFNEVATSVWKSLAEPKTFAELRDILSAEYEVDADQCRRELDELLNTLLAKGLLKKSGPDGNNPA